MRGTVTVADMERLVGREIGTSPWVTIDQRMISAFADVTRDHQPIHVDPDAAARTRFRSTIAHGFLTLSLLSHFSDETLPRLAGADMSVNYGFNRLRFVSPVASGSRIRARFVLNDIRRAAPDRVETSYAVTVEIEGSEKPALVADWQILFFLSAIAPGADA